MAKRMRDSRSTGVRSARENRRRVQIRFGDTVKRVCLYIIDCSRTNIHALCMSPSG
jgi:hypothetical protein